MNTGTGSVRHVTIVSVPVADQDRAKAFYVDVLGMELVADRAMGPMRWVQVRPVAAQTSLTLVTWFESMKAGSLKGLVLEVDDVDAARQRIAARGGAPREIHTEPWGVYFEIDDPDGNGLIVQKTSTG